MSNKITCISKFLDSLIKTMSKGLKIKLLEIYQVPSEIFDRNLKNGFIHKKKNRFFITGFEMIEVIRNDNDTPKNKEATGT